jgi:predicted RNase H-like HicB family nuclease
VRNCLIENTTRMSTSMISASSFSKSDSRSEAEKEATSDSIKMGSSKLSTCNRLGTETREEAVRNASIAIENWIDTAKELKREIPAPVDVTEFERLTKQKAEELRNQFQQAVNEAIEVATKQIDEWHRGGLTSLFGGRYMRVGEAPPATQDLDPKTR